MECKPERKFMELALNAAYRGIEHGDGGPFGACIVKHGMVIAVAHNTVLRDRDPTAHAEINAIRLASKKLGTYDLSGCTIYTTTEPCPMCFSAIHWARIGCVVYGTKIEDVSRRGFNELPISSHQLKTLGKSDIVIIPDFMRDECMELLKFWDKLPTKQTY